MGAAFEVYNERGYYGMAEEIYQECLEMELEIREVPFIRMLHKVQKRDCGRRSLNPRARGLKPVTKRIIGLQHRPPSLLWSYGGQAQRPHAWHAIAKRRRLDERMRQKSTVLWKTAA